MSTGELSPVLPDTAAVAMSPGSERGASQENRSDIVLENPVSGWAWSEQGWNWLPLDAEQVYQSWPLMNDKFYPNDVSIMDYFTYEVFNNPSIIQFF